MNSRDLEQKKDTAELVAEKLVRRIVVKKGGLFLLGEDGGPIQTLAQGDKGDKGDKGDAPVKDKDYFDGKDGNTPVKGKDYFDGKDGIGLPPEHKWEGFKLYFKNPDGSWDEGKDLTPHKGDKGDTPKKGVDYFDGKAGDKGDKPAHRWDGTRLSFENPDGSRGEQVDLKYQIPIRWQGTKLKIGDSDYIDLKGESGKSIKGEQGKGIKGEPGVAPWEVVTLCNNLSILISKVKELEVGLKSENDSLKIESEKMLAEIDEIKKKYKKLRENQK